ncbi:A-kinase anchor protein SPHKAP isoform X2 [Siniperca chuatsi]|uniref:A-kinase anchor protein SPHKAP isoform X2 n=1 Tax=Siniperca chuatsi TaxID=119488 RepID=UPI001CE1412A|nr:A-kinase anchor protein SPHKAP isoform X2 [Siniperca chuatsi]XP_044059316.1 A-kinase anchor protein SPHKAP isoform X2 [Siniperca chuatsi]
MLSSLFTVLRTFTELNFQSSAMFEGSESVELEGGSTESTVASSISACKKVLCSNSVLDSSEYWLRNEKALCRLGLLDDDTEGSCTMICFVNLDPQKTDYRDDKSIKKLASVSPELPKLVELLTVHQPKENEILLLGGLEASDTFQTHPHSLSQGGQQQSTGVCLVQCSGQRNSTQPSSIIFDINKFLIGLQWGKERQLQRGRAAGQRVDDDTNRSISSIEEDFLTASEHLGDDSEDDGFRNEPESGDLAESLVEVAQKHSVRLPCQRGQLAHHQNREDAEVKREGYQRASLQTKESAGHYATNLAESVLQDAFIRLSQDETSFVSEAAVSVSLSSGPSTGPSKTKQPSQQRTCSFELPKIVIVQSPDSSDGAVEWPETQVCHIPNQDITAKAREMSENGTQAHIPHHNGGHPSKHVEVALACAASVIGTITTPQLTEQLAMESPSEEDTEEELQEPEERGDYSFSVAMCSMAQVAGAVAAVELTKESGECGDSDADSTEVYTASRGLMSAAEASTAFTLHCSVAEGTSVEAFRANIAEVLHREAAEVLTQPQDYRSVAHLLEATHNKIVDGITCPKKSYMDEREVDDLINEVADSLFKHALEKAKKKKELEGTGKDAPNLQVFLQDSVNNLLFDILCLTQKKISHISRCDQGSFETQEGDNCAREPTTTKDSKDPLSQLQCLVGHSQSTYSENHSGMLYCTDKITMVPGLKEKYMLEESDLIASSSIAHSKEQQQQSSCRQSQSKSTSLLTKDFSDYQQIQQSSGAIREPWSEIPVHSTEKRGRLVTGSDSRQASLTPQSSLNSCTSLLYLRMDSESRTPITCYADDLAATVVSMATELAAICLENSTGKQPWFCALKGTSTEGPEAYLIPACRTVLRRKDGQSNNASSKKHRAPRLSEIKKKTEEQPELMERLVNRVVDESVNPDEPQDPFALFASEVTARIMNCPELNVVDTSKTGQQRSRLQCERWSRGKASSYESIPEEDADPSGTPNTLGPGSRLGQNLSRGSSISKQSSCESITDEFSRFMVNQMETEGRGFDLLLDYYAGKNASSILAAAVQQAASKKNGHLNVRTSSCLSKQSSTESITEEFYRFMLRDMDKENKEYGIAKTKEWSNSLFPPSPRTPFCIRQSSVPDRRSSDSRLTVNSPIKANSFDGFARNVHGDTLNIFPTNSVSATGLCKSDSCLYQRGKTDQITDMLIHETWSSSIESLMRKNKIIADPEDSIELEAAGDPQPHVQQFANRLAADIVDIGKSALGGQQDVAGGTSGSLPQPHMPVGERRRGFKQSHLSCSRTRSSQEQPGTGVRSGTSDSSASRMKGPRDVPLIHIEGDQRDEETLLNPERTGGGPQETSPEMSATKRTERATANGSSSERDRQAVAVAAVVKRDKRSMSASSEESMGSWSHITPEDDTHEETSSFIQLSEGNGTSSASSLGLADLDAFSDVPTQSTVISEETEKGHLAGTKENVFESSSVRTAGGSSNLRVLLVVNCDLEPECVDSELRVALQWIAASELGLPALYFRTSKEKRLAKFQRVVHLMSQKAWRIADLFSAVVQFCKIHEKEEEEGRSLSSLFDWLLETL